MTLLPFSKNVNMAVGHQLFCEICQRLRSMTEKRKDLEQLNIEKTNSSTIFYVLSVAVVCVGFLSSWLSVSWRTPLSFGQQSSNEMLNFGERSLRFADVPYPKPSPTETEPGKGIFCFKLGSFLSVKRSDYCCQGKTTP